MKRISAKLEENAYIRNDVDSTQFTLLMEKCVSSCVDLIELKDKEYIHGLIKYPHWEKDSDLFSNIDAHNLKRLQNKEIYFILDASVEGYSPFYQIPFFDIIHFNCQKYSVDPKQIIFVSSNLVDEQNYKKFLEDKNYNSCRVLSFNFFEQVADRPFHWNKLIENGCDILDQVCLKEVKEEVNKNYIDKFFSSLSRINRYDRTRATFLLWKHPISKHALISHNKIENISDRGKIHLTSGLGYSVQEFEEWLSILPLTVDRNDFNMNWAMNTPFIHIHNQTLFQLVNETYQSNFYGTSMFFSEKTFRPILCLQPFIVYGQHNCHKELEKLGYKLYRNHFDYDFDDEASDLQRYYNILNQLDRLCNKLNSMSRTQQIDWRFQDEDILRHNFNVQRAGEWNANKIINFLKTLL